MTFKEYILYSFATIAIGGMVLLVMWYYSLDDSTQLELFRRLLNEYIP